jgi:hypothetical protein
MKKMAKIFIAMGMVCTLLFTTGCFGKFALVRKVYEWNNSIAGNDMSGKFVKTLVMYGLIIVPVYEFAGVIDFWILNLIEFWTGSNPLAMKEGQKEVKFVEHNGLKYQIIATHNKFEVIQLNGVNKGTEESVTFNASQLAWYNTSNGASNKLIQYKVENGEIISATYFGTKGQSVVINEAQLNKMFATVAAR